MELANPTHGFFLLFEIYQFDLTTKGACNPGILKGNAVPGACARQCCRPQPHSAAAFDRLPAAGLPGFRQKLGLYAAHGACARQCCRPQPHSAAAPHCLPAAGLPGFRQKLGIYAAHGHSRTPLLHLTASLRQAFQAFGKT
eukprot:1160471-Pelagomonas_calceolata.AAC.3